MLLIGEAAIDAPGGFLFEWWSVFWDIFIARTNDKHSDVAASYLESMKAREQQHSSQQQIQMQQFLLQKRAQQQQHRNVHQQQQQQEHLQQHRRQQKQQHYDENGQFSPSGQNILRATDSPVRQNSAAANSLSAKAYEERMKVPAQMDTLDEAAMKQRFTESSGQLLDSNLTSVLKSASVPAQASGQIIHGSVSGAPGSLQHAQARNQQLQESTQDIKAETNAGLNLRTVGADGSVSGVGVLGSNQVGNNLTLKGWPLTGLEHLRSGLLQHKSFMQPLHHLPFLTLQQQQQLLLQAQQNMASSPADMDSRRLRMLYSSRDLVSGRDIQSNPFTEIIPSGGPPLQNIGSTVQRMESDMLMKIAALQQQQQTSHQQQLLHHPLLSPQPQNSNHQTLEHEKMVAGTVAMHGSLSNSFHGNEQDFKNQSGRKRKQPITPSGPADSTGTANTAGPSPSSSPSTPSAHSPGDTVSTPSLHHNASLSKALVVYGADAPGTIGSPTSQLVHFVDDDCLNDNVFLPHDDVDAINAGSRFIDSDKGSILQEISSARASTSRVLCCHFSSDGKLLATGGHDKKVVLWNAETLEQKSILEEHTSLISDVRFSPSIPRLATSSFDKTVRVWDADKQDCSVRTFTGHFASVTSLDFHPVKDDFICSCDGNNEMRFWSINEDRAVRVAQGGSTQLRFQPRLGGYLAAASDNVVCIVDVETQACMRRFEGHVKHVDSLCWDPSGEYVVSVSEDAVKVWSLKLGNEKRSVHELKCTGSKFSSCAFHPTYPSLLIIGCHQSLELWDMSENRTMTIPAHDGLITSLAVSSSGMVASTGHDKYVKLWGSPLNH